MNKSGGRRSQSKIRGFRLHIERSYAGCLLAYKGGFDTILCYELHSQPINPRMNSKTTNNGYSTGLTFKELAEKWEISVTFLGQLIADHCRRLEE